MENTKEQETTENDQPKNTINEYQQVVASEKQIYDRKIESLNTFMRDDSFKILSPRVQMLLSSQFCTMAVYSFILGEIIQELEN